MVDTIRYLHQTPQTWHNLWTDMSNLDKIYPTLVERFWKMILFRRSRATLILVDHETGCIGNLIYLAFHAYEEHANGRSYASYASIWRQGVVMGSELETNMGCKETWLIIWCEYFMKVKYCMFVGTQLNAFHASKLSIWLNYVKSLSTKEKYES
jgi:hypothetical protein